MSLLLVALMALQDHRLVLEDDKVLPPFVAAHEKEAIGRLSLGMAGRRPALAALAKLASVETLKLSGFEHSEPRKENGKWAFAAGLSDEQVADIARVGSLRKLELWSCSLTDAQRKLLTERLPACRIEENLNKL